MAWKCTGWVVNLLVLLDELGPCPSLVHPMRSQKRKDVSVSLPLDHKVSLRHLCAVAVEGEHELENGVTKGSHRCCCRFCWCYRGVDIVGAEFVTVLERKFNFSPLVVAVSHRCHIMHYDMTMVNCLTPFKNRRHGSEMLVGSTKSWLKFKVPSVSKGCWKYSVNIKTNTEIRSFLNLTLKKNTRDVSISTR